MFRTLARRTAETAAEATPTSKPTSAYVQQMIYLHPPKKRWPPDFKRLTPQARLKYEKKYKRRLTLAMASPRWVKFTKLGQLFTIPLVLIYAVLFMDWKDEKQPFDEVRTWFWNALGMEYVPSNQRPIRTPSSLPQARSL